MTMTEETLSSPETAEAVRKFLRDNPTASVRAIGKAVGIGASTAHRAIARLVAQGEVRIDRLGTSNGYATRYEVLA